MTGGTSGKFGRLRAFLAAFAVLGVAACDENGEFAFPGADGAAGDGVERAAPIQSGTSERDVERPDIFEVTDRGIWDGRPSLGGVWVAHPDAQDPERVIIRNPANGRSVVGALFRRERENPGPLLQVSSDAAEELGVLPGAPTELNVIALRREEIEVEETPELNPVIADLDAPVTVEATPLDPVEGAAAAAIEAAEGVAEPAVDVVLPPAAATPAVAEVAETPVSAPTGPLIQIGVFSVQANADGAAQQISAAGIESLVLAEEAGGRTVWRVVAGPGLENDARDAALTQIKQLGFVDAFAVDG